MNYSSRASTPQEILKLIAAVPSGRELLNRFLPLFESRKVTIAGYPADIVSRLREAMGSDQPIGACFVNDGETGVIHLDFSSAIGVLAPFLVHEIVHALDRTVWDAAGAGLKGKRKDQVFLRAEVQAFEAQAVYMREMKEEFPEYREFLSTQYPRARILHDRLTSNDLVELYGFKVS